MKFIAAVIILLATAACELPLLSQTPEAHPQGPATVHIYRTGSHGNAIRVMIDRQEAFKVSNHELITFQLPAGPHEIAAPYADRKPMVEIICGQGRSIFSNSPLGCAALAQYSESSIRRMRSDWN